MRAVLAALLACVVIAPTALARQAPSAAPLDTLIARTFAYVEQFQKDFGSMVSEERYEQTVRQTSAFQRGGDARRVLRSDFLLVDVPGQGWTPFRDVFEVDGREVRDRQDRLTSLFLGGTTANALEQARRIMNESSRYNIGAGTRNINVPTLALMYFVPGMRGGVRLIEGQPDRAGDGRVLEFTETGRPTLISTTGGRDLAAYGRLWVDEATGTITRTELHADDVGVEAEVIVSFRRDETLGTWVPQRMDERFKRRGDLSEVRGTATYSRFRRFQVRTSEDITSPDKPEQK